MVSRLAIEIASLIPSLTVGLSSGPGGVGFIYTQGERQIGVVRNMNHKVWRIDGDPPGYPFKSEAEATLEMFRRVPDSQDYQGAVLRAIGVVGV